MIESNKNGFFPYTPSTNLLYGLKKALELLQEEGLENVFIRHDRAAAATRRCVEHWGLEINCLNSHQHSSTLTAVRLPSGFSADALRADILERSNMALGNGLGRLSDKVFRIGHLGDFNNLAVAATLAGIEMGLAALGIPHRKGGVEAALTSLGGNLATN
jgi:alanine-glyoxylate transaminase/serine-glyoxylate transaminase/serine-pyruvate transaminase